MWQGRGGRAALLLAWGAGLLLAGPAGAAEVLAPASWTGQWDFVVSYRSRDTGAVVKVDRTTDDICPGQPIGMALFESVPDCQPKTTETGLSVQCAAEVAAGACAVQATLRLGLEQTDPETIEGSGEWTAALSGDCLVAEMDSGQTIEIAAHRRSSEPATTCAETSTFVQKFLPQPVAMASSDRPFARLTVEPIEMEGGAFEVEGAFTLGDGSDGIDPRTDALRVQVGEFETKVPPGSFRLRPARGKAPATYTYEGPIGRARLEVRIVRRDIQRFTFEVQAERTTVRRTASKVPVVLAFGDDTGTTAAATRRPRGRGEGREWRRR